MKTNLFRDPLKMLHFAPEPSLEYIIKKHKNIGYLTADLNQEGVMEKIDITQIPYPDDSFDVILCNHVLEHIPDDRLAMREIYRVLSPGGWAVLQVPVAKNLDTTYENSGVTSKEEREKFFGHWDHVRIYGKDYTGRLENSGFEVEEFSWTDDPEKAFHDPRLNLNRDEVVYYCRKK
jgi:predicted SAM-dependent methyltransferase